MYNKVTVRPGQALHISVDETKIANLFEKITDRAANLAKQAVRRGGRTGRFRDDGSLASTVGEPPHTETGELVRSIHTRRKGNEVSLVSTAKHAEVHEFGDRPFMMPALEQAIEETVGEFADVLKVEAR